MDVRRLRMLLELSRLGSMHEVADVLGTTTSSVSQGIAALARDVGSPLLEPDGRRVRLTPAGRRLADHAVTILAAVESARLDLDPSAEPVGVLRVAGFASADPPLAAARDRRAAHARTPGSRCASTSTSRWSPSTCWRATRSTWRSSTTTTSRPRTGATTTRSPPCGRPSGASACRRGTGAWPWRTSPTATGSSTRATPPTRTRCARSPRAPASCRASCTGSTRWSSSTTWSSPGGAWACCHAGGPRGAG